MKPAPKANREVEMAAPVTAPVDQDAVRARALDLIREGDAIFASRAPMLPLWQDMADTFYVERADFTAGRNPGSAFASHLMTGQPLQARQELANAVGGMLRPPGRNWFRMSLRSGIANDPSQAAKAWMEEMNGRMRGAMYEPRAAFQRAAKQADNDYVTFGNAVISVEPNWRDTSLLFRCWHLKDVVWREDFTGSIDEVHRRSHMTALEAMRLFPASHAPELKALSPEQQRAQELEVRHVSLPAERFGDPSIKARYVSVYVDVTHGHVMEAVGRTTLGYVIPRWQLVSGSVYGYSPTAVASISDARMLQDMTRTILEAGEKAVDPPMIATQEAVRSDVALYPGGITYVDAAYDERLGAAIRPISQDRSGLPLGLDMQQDVRRQIAAAWMLNKLTLPEAGGMTAFEVGQRVQEYVRQALPLFEPIETEYSAALCQETFDVLRAVGAFGRPDDWPEEVQMADVSFQFENPFVAASDGAALGQYQSVAGLLAQHQSIDPDAGQELEAREMFRDAIKATGAPAAWLKDAAEADAGREASASARDAAETLATVTAGGKAAEALGDGVGALAASAEKLDPADMEAALAGMVADGVVPPVEDAS